MDIKHHFPEGLYLGGQHAPPAKQGVYAICGAIPYSDYPIPDKGIVYIGQAGDLKDRREDYLALNTSNDRLRAYLESRQDLATEALFCYRTTIGWSDSQRRDLEQQLIGIYKPIFNVQHV